jgi:hypothetical protein
MTTPPPTRTFAQLIAEHEDGRFQHAATEKLNDVIEQLVEAAGLRGGKADGSMTVTLKLSIDGGMIEINADMATKTPRLKRGKSIYWLTPNNQLSRSNPHQPELELRDVTISAASARNLA